MLEKGDLGVVVGSWGLQWGLWDCSWRLRGTMIGIWGL